MKLWKDNKISGEWELSEEEIAQRFLASSYAEWEGRMSRALMAFIAAPDGLSSVWVDREAYERVEDLILATWR